MNIFVMSRHSGQIKESLPTGRAGVSSAPCGRLRRGLASSRLRPAQRKRVRGFSRCPVGASASFACEAVGFGGFGGLGFGADGGALSGAGGVAGGGFGLNLAVTEEKTPDFHFSPFAPTVAACALKNSASIRRASSLMGAPVFSFRARSVFIWSTSIKSRRAWRRLRFASFHLRFCAGPGAVWGLQQGRLHLRQWQRRRLRRGRLRRYGEPVVKLLTGLFGGVGGRRGGLGGLQFCCLSFVPVFVPCLGAT